MQLFSRILPPEFNLYFASDTHMGSVNTHYHGIEQLIDQVASDRNGFLIFLGDLCEAICVDDVRYDPETVDHSLGVPGQQYRRWIEIFRPIMNQILYIEDGNHDYKLVKTMNFVRDLVCRELNVPYGTYSTKLSVLDGKGDTRFKIFTTHGYGSVNSTIDDPLRRYASMCGTLKRWLKNKASDVLLSAMGHTHKNLVAEPMSSLYLYDDGQKVQQGYSKIVDTENIDPSLRWFINTGSFLKNLNMGSSSYSERAGYDPCELGFVKVRVEGNNIEQAKRIIL